MDKKSLAVFQFGSAVRLQRKRLGISQDELAAVSGLHRTYIGSIERGERNLSLDNIILLAKSLQCSPAFLVSHCIEEEHYLFLAERESNEA